MWWKQRAMSRGLTTLSHVSAGAIARYDFTGTAKREAQMENIFKGVESHFIPDAIRRIYRLLGDIKAALADGPGLAGETFQ